MNPESTDDPILDIVQIARILLTTPEKAIRTVRSAGLTPVRTHTGIGYPSSDIDQLTPYKPHSHYRSGRDEL